MSNLTINPLGTTNVQPGASSVKSAAGTGFEKVFKESIGAINDQVNEAKKLSEGLVSGQHSNIHETMIAMEKSGIAVKLLTKVQSKVIDAYKEVMRLQL